ncbi:MAG: protein kinase domain-containing protein [Chitinispirillaceae bacterium]
MNLFNFQAKDEALNDLRQKERYRLLGSLGKGTYTEIFSCFDSFLNRIVAMKQLRKEFLNDSKVVKSFLNESKLISYIDHPGIVILYSSFINSENLPCYTMKMISGSNLRWELKSKTCAQLVSIFTKLCETMAYVNDKGVVHLDLNPDNIMLGQYGEVTVTDWGSAILYNTKPYEDYLRLVKDAPPPPTVTPRNHKKENSPYASPEQLSEEPLTPSSDIFSMGIILYEMMTGIQPFSDDFKNALDHTPALLNEICPDIPEMLSNICRKMLQKEPYERYHSFHEVLIDLDKFQNSGQAFSTKLFSAGEQIFKEGDPGKFAFTVLEGEVEISRMIDGKKVVMASLGKNEFAGEVAIFSNGPRSATVTAVHDNTAIRVMDRQSVEQELIKLSPWVRNMITGLSRRFLKLNDLLTR